MCVCVCVCVCVCISQGIILVYDITNQKSFDNIQKWLNNIDMVSIWFNSFPTEYLVYNSFPTACVGRCREIVDWQQV